MLRKGKICNDMFIGSIVPMQVLFAIESGNKGRDHGHVHVVTTICIMCDVLLLQGGTVAPPGH